MFYPVEYRQKEGDEAMNAVIIGGSGHIGTYLVPMLVKANYKVINVSRGISKPYTLDDTWREVENVVLDREKVEKGVFEKKIAALNAEIVIDLINFTLEDTRNMAQALKSTNLAHYLFCSTVWVHGTATTLPASEDMLRYPICDYGKAKNECETYLHDLYKQEGFPETSVLPGHICGPGWDIINPVGNHDPAVFQKIARGEEIAIPNLGMETLSHVHADDVAQVFMNAILANKPAMGESFHAVSSEAITLLGFAQAMYRWFGHEPKIKLLAWDEWSRLADYKDHSYTSYLHIARSGSYSIKKGERLIGYIPRHTILETIFESVASMVERGVITR